MSGSKFDTGKPRMGLVTPEFIEGVAKVLSFGAEKYGPYNWAEGIEFNRLYDALQRHLSAWQKGEDIDPESGENHLLHAACELMFLYSFQTWERKGLDNRYIAYSVPSKHSIHIPESIPTTECDAPQDSSGNSSVDADGSVRSGCDKPSSKDEFLAIYTDRSGRIVGVHS